jgi:hypothetical protein
MSEIKVDSIRTYTTNANGIAFPNGLYVGNNVIRPNNTIQSTDFTSTNIGGAGYAVPLTTNSMTSKGYVDNLVNSLLNTAGLSGVSKAYVDTGVASAQSNAQTYADNNFMDKNGNTDHTGGGLTFSGGPYTFTPTSSTPIQIRSSLPAILFNETDVTNASGSIGVDGGVLKLVYGSSLSSNTKGLLVDSSGRVGIGTASPVVALHITNQTAQFDEMLRLEDVTTSVNAPQIGFYKSNSRKAYQQINNNDFIIANSTSNGNLRFLTNTSNERMRIDSAGNVGIGTASPNYKLTLNSSPSPGTPQGVGTDGTVVQAFSYQTSGNVAYSGTVSDHMYGLMTGNIGRLFITEDGSVGIGTASPGVALDVYGEARSSTSTTSASNAKTLTTKDYVDSIARIFSTTIVSSNLTIYPSDLQIGESRLYIIGAGSNLLIQTGASYPGVWVGRGRVGTTPYYQTDFWSTTDTTGSVNMVSESGAAYTRQYDTSTARTVATQYNFVYVTRLA